MRDLCIGCAGSVGFVLYLDLRLEVISLLGGTFLCSGCSTRGFSGF